MNTHLDAASVEAFDATAVPKAAAGLLTPGQVARRLQVSSAWVRDHATRKVPRIRAVKVGKLLRFRPEDIDRFIAESMTPTLPGAAYES